MIKTKVTGAGDYFRVEFTRGSAWVATALLPKSRYTKESAGVWAKCQAMVYSKKPPRVKK